MEGRAVDLHGRRAQRPELVSFDPIPLEKVPVGDRPWVYEIARTLLSINIASNHALKWYVEIDEETYSVVCNFPHGMSITLDDVDYIRERVQGLIDAWTFSTKEFFVLGCKALKERPKVIKKRKASDLVNDQEGKPAVRLVKYE
jgi:hypothetical protein